jgi:putative MATE family efflux protein
MCRLKAADWNVMAKDMTKGSEAKLILLFALPIMLGLVLQQLYNTVDSVVVGQYLGEAALSAVGTCSALTMFVVSFSVGLSNGAGIVLAQYFGAKKFSDMRKTLATALYLLVGLGVIITVLGLIFAKGMLSNILSAPDEILGMAMQYFQIYCVGLVFQFVYNVIAAALRSIGDSRASLIFLLISSVLNIILDLAFVLYFGWGVAGTAIATVISQAVSAVVSIYYMWKKYEFYRVQRAEAAFDREKSSLILKLGVPSMVQMCIVSGGNVLVQRVVNSFGTSAIAAATAAGRIENYLFIPCQGFNNGISTFTGQNIGAGDFNRVFSGWRKSLKLVIPIAVVLMAGLELFSHPLIALFGVEGEALALGMKHLRFIAPFFVLFAVYMSTAGVLTGSGDVMAATSITLSSLAVRVTITYVFAYICGFWFASLYYAVPIGWAICFVCAVIRFRGGKWKEKAIVRHNR